MERNTPLKSDLKTGKWENWIILICGIWLTVTPWVLSFGLEKYEVNVIMWNFIMVGLTAIGTSLVALKSLKVWPEWLSFFMGSWMMMSPFFLIYYKNDVLLWNSLLFGAIIAGLSALCIPLAEKRRLYYRMLRRDKALKNATNH